MVLWDIKSGKDHSNHKEVIHTQAQFDKIPGKVIHHRFTGGVILWIINHSLTEEPINNS